MESYFRPDGTLLKFKFKTIQKPREAMRVRQSVYPWIRISNPFFTMGREWYNHWGIRKMMDHGWHHDRSLVHRSFWNFIRWAALFLRAVAPCLLKEPRGFWGKVTFFYVIYGSFHKWRYPINVYKCRYAKFPIDCVYNGTSNENGWFWVAYDLGNLHICTGASEEIHQQE